MFVFLKNSTLLTIPSNSVVGRPLLLVRGAASISALRTPNDQRLTTALNTQCLAALLPTHHPIKNHARYKHCRKQVCGQAEHQRRGKTLDRPRTEEEQNHRRHDGGDMGIDDGDPGLAESLLPARGRRLPISHFSSIPLKNHNF